MKIYRRVDKAIDKSEIESKYLWDFNSGLYLNRINLSTFLIDFSQHRRDLLSIEVLSILPNDRIFGLFKKQFGEEHLFISDENLNIKEINTIPKHPRMEYYILSCYYDNSIFIFEKEEDLVTSACWESGPKMYSILQNRWIKISPMPFEFPNSCIGFNQKIITVGRSGMWIYDLFLNSYSRILLNEEEIDETEEHMLIKIRGKLYLIILDKIYCCDDPLLEWTVLHDYKNRGYQFDFVHHYNYKVYYEGKIYYYLRNLSIVQFNLAKYKSKTVGKVCLNDNKIIQKI